MTKDVDELIRITNLPVFDLEGWTYIGPAEGGVDIYRKGRDRVLIHRTTGRLLARYKK